MKKKLPIGVQDFPKLIEGGFLYVDKTRWLAELIQTGNYYFLSRPRRFGKSLFLSTLREIFLGNQALFKGLWIENKIDWTPRPVLSLDFSQFVGGESNFDRALANEMDRLAEQFGLQLNSVSSAQKFRELIQSLGQERGVAILIDEYDKPIIQHIDQIELAEQNRDVLRDFYAVIKGNDKYISFFIITGVSKFSHVSLFSDLNNLEDITIDEQYAEMLGYTEQEIRESFPDYFPTIQEKYQAIYPDIFAAIKEWYNGYSWDGIHFVYNPFSILNFLRKKVFRDYWFQTGTPTFLIKTLRQNSYSIFDLKDRKFNLNFFNRFEISNLEVNSLLFQTGYLTIKHIDLASNVVTLDFPNREVQESFSIYLLSDFTQQSKENAGSLLVKIRMALKEGDWEDIIRWIQSMFQNLAYAHTPAKDTSIQDQERYYHSIFYLLILLLGYDIRTEVMTLKGRVDVVLFLPQAIYVMEFKIGNAHTALSQIKHKKYAEKYISDGRPIYLVGIGFDTQTQNIGSYLIEPFSI